MKAFLLHHLICPACLPKEFPLGIKAHKTDRRHDDDILSGELHCPKCSRIFPIKEGIAYLQANQNLRGMRYEDPDMVDRYLWSHYSDMTDLPASDSAPFFWDSCLEKNSPASFDAGCAVGRLVFEMGRSGGMAVGCDLSESFIRAARNLMHQRSCRFSLPLEGKIRESFTISLPESWRTDTIDFIVADAQALPFSKDTFQQVSSLNLLDRVPHPLAHLYEMNRVAAVKGASFLFADPFSWLTSPAPEERWLGGTISGPYSGRGNDNVRDLLQGKGSVMLPAWTVTAAGRHGWWIRTHQNHSEHIVSDYMIATR